MKSRVPEEDLPVYEEAEAEDNSNDVQYSSLTSPSHELNLASIVDFFWSETGIGGSG